LEAALALLVTIDPVIDIFRTVAIVLPNCATAAFIYRRRGALVRTDETRTAKDADALASAAQETAV
jgi:Na+/H+-dicarboxylate symporter